MSSNKVQTDGYPEEEDTMVSAMLGLFFYRFVPIFFDYIFLGKAILE
jgi:hypothetical protein